jgi:hypothetical protein
MWHALPGRTSGGGFTEGCLTAVSCQTMCVLMRPPVRTRRVFLDLCCCCRVCRRHEMDGRRMTVVLMRARAGESLVLATDNYDTMRQITWNHQTTLALPPERDTQTPSKCSCVVLPRPPATATRHSRVSKSHCWALVGRLTPAPGHYHYYSCALGTSFGIGPRIAHVSLVVSWLASGRISSR